MPRAPVTPCWHQGCKSAAYSFELGPQKTPQAEQHFQNSAYGTIPFHSSSLKQCNLLIIACMGDTHWWHQHPLGWRSCVQCKAFHIHSGAKKTSKKYPFHFILFHHYGNGHQFSHTPFKSSSWDLLSLGLMLREWKQWWSLIFYLQSAFPASIRGTLILQDINLGR